jgi:OOP family OmpA-OmpF porin
MMHIADITRGAKIFAAVGALALASGCATGWNVDALKSAERVGSPFTVALANGYQEYAEYESAQMRDWIDADYFARKGLQAAAGEVVQPEDLANWNIPPDKAPELADARAQLIAWLESPTETGVPRRDADPERAALCQVRFDCWVEQAEENHQPTHIAACRDALYACLADQPVATAANFIILFDFDRADLTQAGTAVVNEVIAAATADPAASVNLVGHADTSGPQDYNMGLSIRRANTVRDALIAGGIQPERIFATGKGETEPAVPTGDGVRNQANRRVEVTLM